MYQSPVEHVWGVSAVPLRKASPLTVFRRGADAGPLLAYVLQPTSTSVYDGCP